VVAVGLENPVALDVIRTPLAILAPVMGMAFVPTALSVSLVGPVVGIAGQFVSLPLGLPGPLAGLVGTEPLGFDSWIRQKQTPAMDTSNVAAHDFLLSEAMTLSEGPHEGRTSTTTKAHAEAKGIDVWEGRKKKRGGWFNFSPVMLAEILPGDNNPPPVYQSAFRVVDVEAYISLETNRSSVPERLMGQRVEVLKYPDRVRVFFDHQKVADHPRLIGKRDGKITAKGHHAPLAKQRAYQGPAAEEHHLRGHADILDRYVTERKKRTTGRGVARLKRLLNLKRTSPEAAFLAAVELALQYGLYDLTRLERMILERVAGDFFHLEGSE
jgi:hypothetical protein